MINSNTIRRPKDYRQLLQVSKDSKTVKGEKYGYLTGIMYLAPADESGIVNVCPKSTAGCRAACLYTSGMAGMYPKINQARINKTHYMVNNASAFEASLRYDIAKLVLKAEKLNLVPAVRINGTSDLPKLARKMAQEFPSVQFYDYTKIPRPWTRTLPNYHLTFSLSENNWNDAEQCLANGVNVCAVFDTLKSGALPNNYMGFPVHDGDQSDLRFIDPSNVIVGVRAKGRAKKDESGFVQIT